MPVIVVIAYSRWIILYLIVVCLIWIAGRDAQTHRISNRSVRIFGMLAAAERILCPEVSWQMLCLGIVAVSVPMLFISVWKAGAFGGGDVKLMAAGGLLFGANGIWQAFCVGILLAGVWTFVMLLCKKVNRKTKIAFGPFLCAGMLFSLFLFF